MPFGPSQEKMKRRVLVHGLPYFGNMFADSMSGDGWGFRYYPDGGAGNFARIARDLVACDIVHQIGGRLTLGKFLAAAKFLGKDKIIMVWCGSDVLAAQEELGQGKAVPWIAKHVHHWADSENIAAEIRAMGLACENVLPIPDVLIPDQPQPLPGEFRVLSYVPGTDRGELYGLDLILEVTRQLPRVQFVLVGLNEGTIADPPANLEIHKRLPLKEFYSSAAVVWRPTRHDGLSYMVLEALGYGRHVLWSYPFPGCAHVTSAADARDEILRLQDLHLQGQLGINTAGVMEVAEKYSPRIIKEKILRRMEQILEPGRVAAPSSSEVIP